MPNRVRRAYAGDGARSMGADRSNVEAVVRRYAMGVGLVLCAALAAPVHAAEWSLGATGGFNYYATSEGGRQSFGTGLPFAGPSLEFQPALRLEARGRRSRHAFAVDFGLGFQGLEATFATRSAVAVGSLLHAFGEGRGVAAFASLEGGVGYFSYEDLTRIGPGRVSGASALYGGGLGLFHRMKNGHGRVRFELRYLRVGGATDHGLVIVPRGHSAGALAGFDLLLN